MAYNKTLWQNNSLPAINEGNLNKIEQGIYEAHNNIGNLSNLDTANKSNLVEAINEVNANDINRSVYSTKEQIIGKWIDGKPIYRKIYNIGALPNSTTKTVQHNISGLNQIVTLRGIARAGSTTTRYAYPNINVDLLINSENIYIVTTSDQSAFTSNYIILEYTKTTD